MSLKSYIAFFCTVFFASIFITGQEMAKAFPENSYCLLSIPNVQLIRDNLASSPGGKIFQEAKVREYWKKFCEQKAPLLLFNPKRICRGKIEHIFTSLRSLTVGVFGHNVPHVVIIAETTLSQISFNSALKSIIRDLSDFPLPIPVFSKTYRDRTYCHILGMLFWTFVGDKLIIGDDCQAMSQIVENIAGEKFGGIEKKQSFQAAMAKVGTRYSAFFFIDLENALPVLGALPERIRQPMDILGVNLRTFAIASIPEPKGAYDIVYLQIPTQNRLTKLFPNRQLSRELLSLIPEESVFVAALPTDPKLWYAMADEFGCPPLKNNPWISEIVKSLGQEGAIFATLGAAPIPDVFLCFRVEDRDRLLKIKATMVEHFNLHNFPLSQREYAELRKNISQTRSAMELYRKNFGSYPQNLAKLKYPLITEMRVAEQLRIGQYVRDKEGKRYLIIPQKSGIVFIPCFAETKNSKYFALPAGLKPNDRKDFGKRGKNQIRDKQGNAYLVENSKTGIKIISKSAKDTGDQILQVTNYFLCSPRTPQKYLNPSLLYDPWGYSLYINSRGEIASCGTDGEKNDNDIGETELNAMATIGVKECVERIGNIDIHTMEFLRIPGAKSPDHKRRAWLSLLPDSFLFCDNYIILSQRQSLARYLSRTSGKSWTQRWFPCSLQPGGFIFCDLQRLCSIFSTSAFQGLGYWRKNRLLTCEQNEIYPPLPLAKEIVRHIDQATGFYHVDQDEISLTLSLPFSFSYFLTPTMMSFLCHTALALQKGYANRLEVKASRHLREIYRAEMAFEQRKLIDQDNDGRGEFALLSEIAKTGTMRNGKPNRLFFGKSGEKYRWQGEILILQGYCYLLYLPGQQNAGTTHVDDNTINAREQRFVCYAWPVQNDEARCAFAIDQHGEIWVIANKQNRYLGTKRAPKADAAYARNGKNPQNFDAPLGGNTQDYELWVRMQYK